MRPVIATPDQEQDEGESHSGRGCQNLHAGDIVRVRSEAEILSTLDRDSSLEALAFTPEMRKYCGGSYRVLRRVNRVIVEGRSGVRRMRNAVILEGVTCDGSAHEGCGYRCLLLWKEPWLKRPDTGTLARDRSVDAGPAAITPPVSRNGHFTCQSTSVLGASSPLPFWHVDQYLWDIREGVLKPRVLARTWFIVSYNKIRSRLGLKKRYLIHGHCKSTPTASLGLRPGELVRVKSREEIEATLDSRGRNRGLGFTPEMLSHCGKTYRVSSRMDRMIVETTHKMQKMADAVLLEGVHCQGEAHFNCHRRCRPLWKEIWLERVQR